MCLWEVDIFSICFTSTLDINKPTIDDWLRSNLTFLNFKDHTKNIVCTTFPNQVWRRQLDLPVPCAVFIVKIYICSHNTFLKISCRTDIKESDSKF